MKNVSQTLSQILTLSLAFGVGATIIGCAQQDQDKVKDRAEVEGRGAAKAEQVALDIRAQKMENDLARRHRFYQSLKGIYQGSYTTVSGVKFETKLRLIPSLPPYVPSDRIRTPEEVAADLNNLYFNIQILHWNPEIPSSASGCVFEAVSGDLEKGRAELARAECPNVYSVRIVDMQIPFQKPGELEVNSAGIAQKILAGEIKAVSDIKIFMQPSNNPVEFELLLKRIEQ